MKFSAKSSFSVIGQNKVYFVVSLSGMVRLQMIKKVYPKMFGKWNRCYGLKQVFFIIDSDYNYFLHYLLTNDLEIFFEKRSPLCLY